MNLSKTLNEYFSELSSNSPTPGGGNVSAMLGALASSLGTMVCNLTIGKKKYAEVEQEMISAKVKLEEFRNTFLQLAEEDNLAFTKVMDAMKLPKESDSDKQKRSQAIEDATIGAADVPSKVLKTAKELLPFIRITIDKGNSNSLSDAGVAATLITAASQGAYLNVLINCKSMSNQIFAEEIKNRSQILLDEIWQESYLLIDKTYAKINQQ